MPHFDTPGPISATIDLAVGNLLVNAGDRSDTVVEVRPSDPDDEADVQAAEQTRVEYAKGTLVVRAPRTKARWWIFRWEGSIDVTVELPAGSRVEVTAGRAEVRSEGRLGESRFSVSAGDVRIDQTGKLRVSSTGDISVDRAAGPTELTSASGNIRVREIDGPAVVKTSKGDLTVGQVTGDLRANTASGDISVERALAGVGARTAAGSVRIGEVVRGSVVLETAAGELEVGVREGTAAWLDVRTHYGSVRSSLDPADGPGPSQETVEVRARTSYGDIVIRRS
jgi:DUF4097 and DUF4098 domain-containing protein YvlB